MADVYPWGTQAPQTRLAKLNKQLRNSERSREKYLEDMKSKLAVLDENDRATKSEIKQCMSVIEKERSEANAASLSRLMLKVLGNTNAEAIEAAIKDGTLEERLASLASGLEPPSHDEINDKKRQSTESGESARQEEPSSESVNG